MPSLRRKEKLICFKIVYCGCALSGKSTNLAQLKQRLGSSAGELITTTHGVDETTMLEFEAPGLSLLPDYGTLFQVFTAPGEVQYSATQALLLRYADGVVFVVDSQTDRQPDNLKAWQNLHTGLKQAGLSAYDLPLVLQYNKRDLPNAADVDYLEFLFNNQADPMLSMETEASSGRNVMATLNAICQGAASHFQQGACPADPSEELHADASHTPNRAELLGATCAVPA